MRRCERHVYRSCCTVATYAATGNQRRHDARAKIWLELLPQYRSLNNDPSIAPRRCV